MPLRLLEYGCGAGMNLLYEGLCEDLSANLSRPKKELVNQFDLVVGVNTFRYAVRLRKAAECSNDIASLLKPGGYSIVIDTNNRFRLFRSRLRDRLVKPTSQTWLPTLGQYVAPFEAAGLEVVQQRNSCWVPHSANGLLLTPMRGAAPVLDLIASTYAMRSLVVARKPHSTAATGTTMPSNDRT